jgi:long-chain acyl-CoA synthetase
MLVGELLDRALAANPEGEAVVDLAAGTRLGYRAYAETVNRLASALRAHGVRAGQPVGLHLPNVAAYPISFFALQRLGATVVPMNPLYKPDELAYILGDAGIATAITAAPLLPGLLAGAGAAGIAPRLLVLGGAQVPGGLPAGALDWHAAVAAGTPDPVRPDAPVGPDDVATCLYTSGTTGRPKGTMLTHDNLTFDIQAAVQVFTVSSADRFLCVLPLFHSFAQMACLIAATYAGAALVVLPRFRPTEVLEAIGRERITIFPAVPAMYAAMLAAIRDPQTYDLSTLRLAITGGAPMPLPVLHAFEHDFHVTVLEGNGPTEASPVAYVNPERGPRKPGSVGLPLPGVEVRIVDADDRDVPPGEPGEILIRGRNVMKGYHHQPELTARVLRGGWLHTGDVGRRDEDGYIYIVDRIKDLILVGGLNVYPREVEEALAGHPAVAEACVVGAPDSLRGEEVVAFVVARGQRPPAAELIAHCRRLLANYKCPRRIVYLDEMPRNATGKADKQALRQQVPPQGDS